IYKSGDAATEMRGGVTFANEGGSITFDSSGTGAALNIGHDGGEGAAHLVNSAGTSSYSSNQTINLRRNSSLSVSGGTMDLSARLDFAGESVSGNAASINVTDNGTLNL